MLTGGSLKDIGSIGGYSTNPENVTWTPASRYSYTADPASSVKSIVMANAGVGKMNTTLPTIPPATPTPPVNCGDVNGSGNVDIIDALMAAQFYVGLNPQPFNPDNADVNGDGSINIVDALMIAQYYVGLVSLLGC